ncbi:MAG TPA: zinc-ribbon domain-containing protein [Sphingomonadales bacterium]|nr:zinc-ribbon domain-containing protein [Sphingomonadales bacterium]
MIIACPECQTRFVVSPAAIGEEGRRVQCSRCHAVWREAPPPEGAEIAPERVVLPSYLQKAAKAGGEEADRPGAVSEEDEEKPLGIFGDEYRPGVPAVIGAGGRAAVIGWALLGVFALGFAGSAYVFRDWLEDRSAAAATLYQKWDVLVLGKKPRSPEPAAPVTILQPHPSSYLTLRQSPQIRFTGDQASLVIAIEIRNAAPFDVRLPPLRGVIRDASGLEMHSWVEPIEPPLIPAGETLQIETVVETLPEGAASTELSFDWR